MLKVLRFLSENAGGSALLINKPAIRVFWRRTNQALGRQAADLVPETYGSRR
jgi:hypothetical protein